MENSILEAANYTLNPYGLAPFITGILAAALGTFVLLRERRSLVSVTFFLLSLTGAFWLACYLGIYSAQQPEQALWWIKSQNVAVTFIPSLTYLFTLAIIGKTRFHRLSLTLTLILSALFCLSIPLTDWHIAETYHYPWGYYARYGPLSIFFLAYFFTMTVVSLRLLWVEYQRAGTRIHQRRLKAFLIAFSVAYIGSIDYLPAFGIPVFPAGYLAIFVFLVLAARAIWRYRLVGITPAFAATQILRTMADTLLVLDHEGVVRVANQAACHLFGRAEKELIGRPLWTLSVTLLPRERLERALRSGVIQRYEATHTTQDGEELVLDISVSAIPDQEGGSVGIVCIARDITTRRKPGPLAA